MICKIGNILIVRGHSNCILCAFVITNTLCVIDNNIFKFNFRYFYNNTIGVHFTLLTDQNFIWDKTLIKVL
jgi:nitrous oxidase accessory protein NosD